MAFAKRLLLQPCNPGNRCNSSNESQQVLCSKAPFPSPIKRGHIPTVYSYSPTPNEASLAVSHRYKSAGEMRKKEPCGDITTPSLWISNSNLPISFYGLNSVSII